MGTTAKVFYILGVFFAIMAAVYTWATMTFTPEGLEPAGVSALIFLVFMAFMVGFYLQATNKRRPGDRYDDNPRGEIADAAGEYGFFAPYSWTPIALAAAGALAVAGLAVDWWLFFLAVGFGIFAVIAWVFEFFTGEHHV